MANPLDLMYRLIVGNEEAQKKRLLEHEYQLKTQAEKPTLLATLAAKGLLPATNLPKQPSTIEDYQGLARGAGQQLSADTPETARRLIEISGISIPKRPQTFPIEGLGEFYQSGIGRNIGDVSDLTSEQQLQGRALARKIYGVRGAEYGLPAVYEEMRMGKSIDKIEDSLRYAGQSKEFTGPLRSAAQQIMTGKPAADKQSTFDDLDDLQGNQEEQKSYLKRMAMKQAGAEESRSIVGKERTIKLLDEIQGDLNNLEKMGVDTNIFTGTAEQVASKLGTVVNPEARKIATKIAAAVQGYRRSMTGVQFGMPENKEYKVMFPNIGRTANFNTANINGLKEVMRGDLDNFYSLAMGEKNYQKLFGEETQSEQPQDMVKIRNKKTGEVKSVPKSEVNKYAK